MKIKQMAQVALICCSILAVSACSTKKHGGYNNGMGVGEAEGAQAAGIGEGENFGNGGAEGGARSSSKRTYYFDFDSNVVQDQDKPKIYAMADYLMSHPNKHIIVEGHTDPRGSREYNVALGERRANAVAEILKSKGVNPGQIRVVSYGAERLAVPGRSEQDYQLDRRAVITFA